MNPTGKVVVAYGGVHQAYQIALACHEAGCLERFYCSWLVAPGKWGGLLNKMAGGRLAGWAMPGLPPGKVVERPWPYLRKRITDRLHPASGNNWLPAHENFDRWVAGRLLSDRPGVFVGTETCDLWSLRAARQCGAATVHDCPQIHPAALASLMEEASARARLHLPMASRDDRMEKRKLEEYELADRLLVYSPFHRQTFESQGIAPDKILECPLWVDANFWTPGSAPDVRPGGPLRVLFAGSLSLRKGLPFLLDAFNRCKGAVQLTLAGPLSPECRALVAKLSPEVTVLGPQSKPQLRELYRTHDVLALPSVADSFGFVALEAMACGLPVLISQNCGAPAPEAWRIPSMDAASLAERMLHLAGSPETLAKMREVAAAFVGRYTPVEYRKNISRWMMELQLQKA